MRLAALALVVACSSPTKPPTPWLTDEAAAFARARQDHKAVAIDFTETWSAPSSEMSRLLDTPAICAALDGDFIRLRLDISNQDERVDALRARYGATTLPGLVFVDRDGTVLARDASLLDAPALRSLIAGAAAKRAR